MQGLLMQGMTEESLGMNEINLIRSTENQTCETGLQSFQTYEKYNMDD